MRSESPTESIAVEPQQTGTYLSYIEPTQTQKTAGGGPAITQLLRSTTKTGRGRRLSPAWRLMIIFVGLFDKRL